LFYTQKTQYNFLGCVLNLPLELQPPFRPLKAGGRKLP
jgi:hypothetical protein